MIYSDAAFFCFSRFALYIPCRSHELGGEVDRFAVERCLTLRFQSRYPFTSKLICGDCGSTFKRHMNTTGSQKYPVWVCKQHLH